MVAPMTYTQRIQISLRPHAWILLYGISPLCGYHTAVDQMIRTSKHVETNDQLQTAWGRIGLITLVNYCQHIGSYHSHWRWHCLSFNMWRKELVEFYKPVIHCFTLIKKRIIQSTACFPYSKIKLLSDGMGGLVGVGSWVDGGKHPSTS